MNWEVEGETIEDLLATPNVAIILGIEA